MYLRHFSHSHTITYNTSVIFRWLSTSYPDSRRLYQIHVVHLRHLMTVICHIHVVHLRHLMTAICHIQHITYILLSTYGISWQLCQVHVMYIRYLDHDSHMSDTRCLPTEFDYSRMSNTHYVPTTFYYSRMSHAVQQVHPLVRNMK